MGAFTDYVTLALYWALLGLKLWALVDAARRPSAGFPAIDRQTKQIWLIGLGVAVFCHGAAPWFNIFPIFSLFGAFGLVGLLGTVGAIVYLVDVRKKLAELGPGGGSAGPYGRW